MPAGYPDRPPVREAADETGHLVQGTIQRIDYRKRELRVVNEGRVWHFLVGADCKLWFNDTPALLRCFHPLDRVRVLCRRAAGELFADALYSWER
jgi:hypothetical protein